jgi:holin-like protein
MIFGLFVLLAFQALGELIKVATATMLPGPVIGLLMLFVVLLVRRGIPQVIGDISGKLIAALPLLLTPPSVGIFFVADQLHGKGYEVAFAVIVGTVLTLLFSGLLMTALIRLAGKNPLS